MGKWAVVLAGLALAGCSSVSGHVGSTPTTTNSTDLKVMVGLGVDASSDDSGASCTATYQGSGQVTVTDQKGTVLGQGEITQTGGAGTWDAAQHQCDFTIDIGTVSPSGITQYGVLVGDSKQPVYFSAAEAAADNYELAVSYT